MHVEFQTQVVRAVFLVDRWTIVARASAHARLDVVHIRSHRCRRERRRNLSSYAGAEYLIVHRYDLSIRTWSSIQRHWTAVQSFGWTSLTIWVHNRPLGYIAHWTC